MNVNTLSPNHQSLIDKARENLKRIEDRGVSKAETLEDLRDTTGKSFRTADLEKLMEKYDPESYAKYSKMSRTADGARSQGGLAYLSNWIDNVKEGLKNGGISSEGTNSSVKKTAADELSYLSKKYSNYSFVAANYTKGMRYGSNSTVNVAISPQFLAKMASDPELEAEYEKNIAAMQKLDEQFAAQQAAMGWRVEQGWAIDKDGGISKWIIGHKDSNAKSQLEKMSEKTEKIREENKAKKEEKAKLDEKRKANKEEKAELKEKMEKAGKDKFGDKFKEAIVIMKNDENSATHKEEKVDDLKEEREIGDILDFNA